MSGQPGAPVSLPVGLRPGGDALPWLVPLVTAVLERAGGSTYRLAGDGIAALVTARASSDFDVVLELAAESLTLRVWGLEREYALPVDDPAAASDAALRAVGDWLALLDGSARLVVYYRSGAACCWTVTDRDHAPHPDRGWHPRRPPARFARWVRRWRRRVLQNGFLDRESARELHERALDGARARAAERRAAAREAVGARTPVAAA